MTEQTFTLTTQSQNPGIGTLVNSGDVVGDKTTNWLIHIQTLELVLVRNTFMDSLLTSIYSTPKADYNFIDAHYTINTTREIIKDATFTGSVTHPQVLTLTTTNKLGGFGPACRIYTETAGYIRSEAEKDAKGNFVDTTGICTQEGNYPIDKRMGAYDEALDTPAAVNAALRPLLSHMSEVCPDFLTWLVQV